MPLYGGTYSFAVFYASSGVGRQASSATIDVIVMDCAGKPVEGATVTSTAGAVRYPPNSEMRTVTSAGGHAYVLDVPPGLTTIGGTAKGKALVPVQIPAPGLSFVRIVMLAE